MSKETETRAFILRSTAYGDSDRIVSVLTERFGKIRGIARGARKSIKRFGGCLEPFTLVNLVVQQRKGLSLLLEGRVVRDFREIKGDLERFCLGSYMLELTDSMIAEDEQDNAGAGFSLFFSGMEALDAAKVPEVEVRRYEVMLLRLAGYMPSFLTCAACGKDVLKEGSDASRSSVIFSNSAGGVLCRDCFDKEGGEKRLVSPGTLRTLDAVAGDGVSFTRHALEESGRILQSFITHRLGRRLKSLDFLNKVGEDRTCGKAAAAGCSSSR